MRALIASSSTGGHIYPALAIAEEIQRRDAGSEILFATAKWEIGKDIVSSAGYRQVYIDVLGFDRKNPLNSFRTLVSLLKASAEVKEIIRDFRPDICFGTGGHISGPVIRGAKKAGIRTMIQEQNVIPGVANKLSEKYAEKVFVGFDEAAEHFRDKSKVIVSGNPVRSVFSESALKRKKLREKYAVPEGAFCTLFFGGSQGAVAINTAAADTIERLSGFYYSILVTGRDYFEEYEKKLSLYPKGSFLLMDYADAIYELYSAADLIVSRAGALTVSEIACSGKASILIPSPNVTNNHQYYNAKTLSGRGAAVLLSEEEAANGGLAAEIMKLAADPDAVRKMSKAAAKTAKPDAIKVIADEIFRS